MVLKSIDNEQSDKYIHHDIYYDKTLGELKKIDKQNGNGGIFIQAPKNTILTDDFKPRVAVVWKPNQPGYIPDKVDIIEAAGKYYHYNEIPVTLIYNDIHSIAPGDTEPVCRRLTQKQCCNRVKPGECVKGCEADTTNNRNTCPQFGNVMTTEGGWKLYDKHHKENCVINEDNIQNSCRICKGTGTGEWIVDSNSDESIKINEVYKKYEKVDENNKCYIETVNCLSGPSGIKKCSESAIKVANTKEIDDSSFSTHIKNLPLNRWFHVAISAENNTAAVYVDGRLISSSTFANPIVQNNGDLFVTNNGGFGGFLTQLRYYNKVITYDEVEYIYKLGPNPSMQLPDINKKMREITGKIPVPRFNVKTTWSTMEVSNKNT